MEPIENDSHDVIDNENDVQKPKKKRKIKLGKSAASSAKVMNGIIPKYDKRERNLSEEVKLVTKLSQKAIKTWEIGCWGSKLKTKFPNNVELQDRITGDLGYVTALINKLTHLAQLATEFLIESLLDAPNHLITNQIISSGKDDDGGKLYWMNMLAVLHKGKYSGKMEIIKAFLNTNGHEHFFLDPQDRFKSEKHCYLNPIIQEVAATLATSFRKQVIGSLPLLVAKVLEETPEEEKEAKLQQILAITGNEIIQPLTTMNYIKRYF